jgi:hypothetical protein
MAPLLAALDKTDADLDRWRQAGFALTTSRWLLTVTLSEMSRAPTVGGALQSAV